MMRSKDQKLNNLKKQSHLLMAQFIRDSGSMDREMAKVHKFGQVELDMKASGKLIKQMELGNP